MLRQYSFSTFLFIFLGLSFPVFGSGWSEYNQATKNRKPCPLLIEVIGKVIVDPLSPPTAIDLGAGGGRDTMALLKKGWTVIAIDIDEESMDALKLRAKKFKTAFDTQVVSFEKMTLKKESADLINASLALPFVEKTDLKNVVWPKIAGALKKGGHFIGQFFGPKHTWAKTRPNEISIFSLSEIVSLVEDSGLVIDKIERMEIDTNTEDGKTHWQEFNVVASKPSE